MMRDWASGLTKETCSLVPRGSVCGGARGGGTENLIRESCSKEGSMAVKRSVQMMLLVVLMMFFILCCEFPQYMMISAVESANANNNNQLWHRNIPFVALIHDTNVRNEMEMESRAFSIGHHNNLLHDIKRLRELMSRREVVKRILRAKPLNQHDQNTWDQSLEMVTSLSEPNTQFIVKLKSLNHLDPVERTHMTIQQQLYVKAGHSLGFADTFALVSRTSDIMRHVGQDDSQSIEYITEMESRFKSDLNFGKIQEMALNQTRLHHGHARQASENEPFPKHVHAIVTLIPSIDAVIDGVEMEEATLVAQELKSLLNPYFEKNSISNFNLIDKEKLEISFSPLVALEIGEIIKANPHVHFIERKPIVGLLNMRASSMMQSVGPHPSVAMSSTPFYDLGVFGSNQVVAVSDTGIDWDSCLFYDSSNPTITVNTLNTKHRKIIEYDTVVVSQGSTTYKSDNKDGVDGHGTHVAASVCGSIQNLKHNDSSNPVNTYHGIAPNAKLHFTDLQQTGQTLLLVPTTVSTIFMSGYYANARIFSNSWGSGPDLIFSCSYDCDNCRWKADFEGFKAGDKITNAQCKELFGSDTCCSILNKYNSQCKDIDTTLWKYQDAIALFAQGNSGAISSKENIGSPAVSKNAVSVGASMTSNAAFEESVQYEDFVQKMKDAALPFTSVSECCAYTGTNQEAVRNYCCPTNVKSKYTSNSNIYNENNLAYFSSRGPACGNRIKPDVVGIGHTVVSAHSDGDLTTFQCSAGTSPNQGNSAALMTNSGTSMATLLWEYFQAYHSIPNPSGPLLKAALVHSSIPLEGTVAKTYDESSRIAMGGLGRPNSYEGFGRVYIGGLLKNSDGTPVKLSIFESIFNISTESYKLCFKRREQATMASSSPAFKATLAWYDYPGSVSVVPNLIHDLNLFVNVFNIDKDNKITNLDVAAGNFITKVDSSNNVEKISVDSLDSNFKNQYLSVAVYVASSLIEKQRFALLISHPQDLFEQVSTDACTFSTTLPQETSVGVYVGVAIGIIFFLVIAIGVGVAAYFLVNSLIVQKNLSRHMRLASHNQQDEPMSEFNYYKR
ncbi:hypothetical protein C9374_002122 [Naegleria lovaniensis]|uniref:Peptidase S8/S53 domain-containing protein n=1 Tax=Naegleria lovaniensis TaxID=51637 RepID=A0AA88KR74_NAELO|nr:uncharacterized protein C9374_002122 [Naegleria lovaniensis]KAG2387087.1 hypothetical protein C9374_002122 [Naegleria lovaniensis]